MSEPKSSGRAIAGEVARVHTATSGRELQDRLIRYLADARLRRHPAADLPLSPAEAGKAERFARFLARRYYRDRLVRSFRCAPLLAPQTGRRPEEIVESEDFERLLDDCLLGSLETANRVAEMALAYLIAAPPPGPWWADLMQYESAFFLQMATSEPAARGALPRRGTSAVIRRLTWDVPQLLPKLKRGEPVTDAENLRREITLLFSRTPEGKIYVVEVDEPVSAVFAAVTGDRPVDGLAGAARLPQQQTNQILSSLGEIGAIVLP